MIKRVFTVIIIILIYSCSTSTESDSSKPVSLTYSPNSTTVEFGEATTSSTPTVEDGGKDITKYELTTTQSGISINPSTGLISSTTDLAIGTYVLSVIATNSEGSTTFSNVYTINIVATTSAPISISYSPNNLDMFSTTSKSSAVPTINNGGLTLSNIQLIGTVPNGISINSTTGVITASSQTAIGNYTLSVRLTNSKGSTDFTDVYTIDVVDIANAITFTNDIKPLVLIKCTPCHVDGGAQPNWTVYNTAKTNINKIITRTGNGSMPQNGANGGLTEEQKALFVQWLADGLIE